jgi:hypothetical protein
MRGMSEIITLPHLRTLIGLRVRHLGESCTIVEVLDSPPCLVLLPDTGSTLMPDLHGRPFEYGVQTYTVRVLSEDQTGLNDALLNLEILD